MALSLRPSFEFRLQADAVSVARHLHQGLAGPGLETRWSRVPGASQERTGERTHVLVTLEQARRRFWSPWLHLDVRDTGGLTELHGRYSPHPNVWTAFALGYLLLGAVVFLGSLFASAQTLLRGHSHAWWLVLAALLLCGVMWWSAQVGQRFARGQMEELDARFRDALSSSMVFVDSPGGCVAASPAAD